METAGQEEGEGMRNNYKERSRRRSGIRRRGKRKGEGKREIQGKRSVLLGNGKVFLTKQWTFFAYFC